MKTFFILSTALFLAAAIVLFEFCSKEKTFSNNDNISYSASNRDIEIPTVADSILTFNSFEHLWGFVDYLRSQEADSALVNSAFVQLGIDPNAVEGNNTDHPICLNFEHGKGYLSVRALEENYINSELNAGNDTINSIVANPYWKTVLNKYGSVRVGSRVYRFFDEGGVVIIANNDISIYNAIKYLPFEQITDSYNLRKSSVDAQEWSKYHNVSSAGQTVSTIQIKDVKIAQVNPNNNAIQISNCSFYESNGVSYEWVYANGLTSTGVNPNKTFVENEALQLKVHHENGSIETSNIVVQICQITNFSVVHLGSSKFNFSLTPFGGFTFKWLFGDGGSALGSSVTHQYSLPPGTTVSVTVQALAGNSIVCSFTKTIVLNPQTCGITKEKSGSKTFDNVDNTGKKWRIDGKVWVLNGSVGSSTKTLKRSGFIIYFWNATKVQSISAGLRGYYWRDITVGGVRVCEKVPDFDGFVRQICVPDPNCVTASYEQWVIPENTPRREANKLSSFHRFKRTATSTELSFDPLTLD
ncbi:MAG: PKD domain-containing protein [Saprospiraceae bacterium]